MHYSSEPHMVKATRFKASGKYYDEWALNMEGLYDFGLGPIDAVYEAIKREGHLKPQDWPVAMNETKMFVVVLEPYHKHSYPVVIWLT